MYLAKMSTKVWCHVYAVFVSYCRLSCASISSFANYTNWMAYTQFLDCEVYLSLSAKLIVMSNLLNHVADAIWCNYSASQSTRHGAVISIIRWQTVRNYRNLPHWQNYDTLTPSPRLHVSSIYRPKTQTRLLRLIVNSLNNKSVSLHDKICHSVDLHYGMELHEFSLKTMDWFMDRFALILQTVYFDVVQIHDSVSFPRTSWENSRSHVISMEFHEFSWETHGRSIGLQSLCNLCTVALTNLMDNPQIFHGFHAFPIKFHEFPMGYP